MLQAWRLLMLFAAGLAVLGIGLCDLWAITEAFKSRVTADLLFSVAISALIISVLVPAMRSTWRKFKNDQQPR